MTDSRPLVSIGVPAYNGEKFMREALNSLLAQDYENFELIISNNASTDSTWEICQEYAAKDSRIRIHSNEQNVTALANFTNVLNLARGPYFMWAAVDDLWHPSFISTLVEELENHPEAGVAMCDVDQVDEQGTAIRTILYQGRQDPNGKGHFGLLCTTTSPRNLKYNLFIYGLFRTELLKKVFPSTPNILYNDLIFVSLMGLITRFRSVGRVLHYRRVHKKSKMIRYPNENFLKMEFNDRLRDLKIVASLAETLCGSRLVPWYRKLYAPAGVINLSLLLIQVRFYSPIVKPKIAYCLRKLHLHRLR